MAQKIKRKSRWKRPAGLCFLLVGVVAITGLFAGGVAKYMHRESKEEEGNSEQFYFTSNYLTETGKDYTLSSGTTELNIELRNYADELRWSDSTIKYIYSVTKDETEIVTGESGTIDKDPDKGSVSEIRLSGMSAGTYKVTAEAVSPYSVTLKGTFVIPSEKQEISYVVRDSLGSPYVWLTVSTDVYKGDLNISWTDGLIPDSTQDVFKNVETWRDSKYQAGNTTVSVDAYSSYTYQFFKTDTTKVYTENDIKAEKMQ